MFLLSSLSTKSDKDKFDMKYDTIDKAIINVFKSPSKNLTIEFQGGEPL